MTGNNINKAIIESGLKKNFIAKQLGIKYDTLRKKLNGQTEFKVSEIIQLSKILNISMEVLLNGEEN